MITGLVKDESGVALSGVSVSIHSHSEYGTAGTDTEGRFSMPVDGGGDLTVVYQKESFITSHRQVSVAWNDIALCDTVT